MASRDQVEVFAVEDDFYSQGVVLGSRPSDRVPFAVIRVPPDEQPLTEAEFLARRADGV
jgi:hypothetical protein